MGYQTKIDWATHSWSPFYNCPDDGKRSPACDNCYARAWSKRFNKGDFDREIIRSSDKTFNAPLNRKKYKSGDRVFVCSLSDFFHEGVSPELMSDAWGVIFQRPDLIWMFLTKRPERIVENETWPAFHPRPNIWIGVTAENQEQADKRIPLLLKVSSEVHFVSCEPQLEYIDLSKYIDHVEWVISGGESGSHKRPYNSDWGSSLLSQCRAAGKAFFFKQRFMNGRVRTDKLYGVAYKEFPK